MIRLADGRELSSLALEALFGPELRLTLQAQIAEEGPGRLRWRIVPFAGTDLGELQAALLERGRRVLGAQASVSVEFVGAIDPTSAGKFVRAAVNSPR
jgi:hypothetical protein